MSELLAPSDLFHRHAITSSDTRFLIGRNHLITEIANKLAEDEISCVLYGMRGVGKTSIAWQIVSLMRGKNPKFTRDKTLLFNKDDDWKVALHKCSTHIESVGDLLLEMLLDSSSDYSFSVRFRRVYESEENISAIKRKFGINIFKAIEYSEENSSDIASIAQSAKELLSDEQAKIGLFKDVMNRAKVEYPGHRFLIVFDEMDRAGVFESGERMQGIRGLGDFIKNMDGVQFLFVGIGQTIESIISDHQSAPRKLTANDFEAPLLSDEEIASIFEVAAEQSNGSLSVSEEFISRAVEYSGGIPWVAQHTGYEATIKRIMADKTRDISLNVEDFQPAIRAVTKIYEKDSKFELRTRDLEEMGATATEILKIMWRNPSGMSVDRLREAIDPKYSRFFTNGLGNLQEGGILLQRGRHVMFPDPVLRVFVKYYLDNTDF
ncbi:MAG: hypothetical protein AAFP87_04680 [Pseudomonadota bacterium]